MRWHKFGITENQFPKHQHYSGHLLIVAGGGCVWEDLKKVSNHGDVMCVNDIVMHFPKKVTHLYSNDVRTLNHWKNARRPWYKYLDEKIVTHSINPCEGALKWPFHYGNSGLNAILVGLALGYSEITVIGMPFDNTPHYFEDQTTSKFLKQVPDDILQPLLREWGNVCFISGRGAINGDDSRT